MTKTILRKIVKSNFTIVSNEMIQNPNMSNKARGLYVYMLSMPDDWQFCVADLMNRSTDGRDSIKSQLNELEAIGYIKRGQTTNPDGTFGPAYVLVRSSMDLPWPDEPLTENPLTDNPLTENPLQQSTHSTKDPESKNPETKTLFDDPVEQPMTQAEKRNAVWDAYLASWHEFNKGKNGKVPVYSHARKELINRRLAVYSVEDLILAVTGWQYSPFHRGENDGGKVYNSIDLFLRNDEKIEMFMGYHDAKKPVSSGNVNEAHGRQRRASSDIIELDDDEDFIDD